MSRAAFVIALSNVLGRDPTDAELSDFLARLREHVGERIYVPQKEPTDPEQLERIRSRRGEGWSIRRIARTEGLSKDKVHRVLSQNPALFVDKQAA